MNDFDIINEINKVLDMNSMPDFMIIGAFVAVSGYIIFCIQQKVVPGIIGLILPGVAGVILGAMLYIFSAGTS